MSTIDSEKIILFLIQDLSRICSFEIGPDTSLLTSGLLDSMGLVEVIVSVQSKFNIHVEIADIKREIFDTPRMMAAFFVTAN